MVRGYGEIVFDTAIIVANYDGGNEELLQGVL